MHGKMIHRSNYRRRGFNDELGRKYRDHRGESMAGGIGQEACRLRNYPKTGCKPYRTKGLRAFSDSFLAEKLNKSLDQHKKELEAECGRLKAENAVLKGEIASLREALATYVMNEEGQI